MIFRGCGFLLAAAMLPGQWFAGAGGGISTLSADGQTRIDSASTAISLYKPENGPSLHTFAGRHLHNYFSLQASYTWNRNAVAITGSRFAAATESTFQQDFRATTHTAAAEGLLYFRPLPSRVRPYVAGGFGFVHTAATAASVTIAKGPIQLPPASFASTLPMWRTTVGIDIAFTRGFAFRYNFWETISANPISRQLSPPGARGLANFQSIFSLLKTL